MARITAEFSGRKPIDIPQQSTILSFYICALRISGTEMREIEKFIAQREEFVCVKFV